MGLLLGVTTLGYCEAQGSTARTHMPEDALARATGALRRALAGSLSALADRFVEWDVDQNNSVDRDEFRAAVRSLKLDVAPPSNEVCDALFAEFDAGGDGEIAYREYVSHSLVTCAHCPKQPRLCLPA